MGGFAYGYEMVPEVWKNNENRNLNYFFTESKDPFIL